MDAVKRKIIIFFLAAALVTAGPSENGVNEDNLLNLSDYLRYAALNNAQLRVEFENWKAALEQIPQSKALDDPKFTYSYFIEEVETRVGPQRQKFGIMQVFPWFGELDLKVDAAFARANSAKQKYEAQKLELFKQVRKEFYEFSYLGTSIKTANDNLELLKRFEEVARTKYRSSKITHPDIIRIQMELAKLEDVVRSLEKFKEPTVAKLNSILNRDSGKDLQWPGKQEPVKAQLIKDEIIEKIIRNNPEISGLNWQIEAAEAEVELARTKYYPDIGVGVDWIETGNARFSGVSDSGKDAVALMFSVNIPLWQDSYKAGERQAKAIVRRNRNLKIEIQNRKIFEAIRVIYEIQDSNRKIDLYGNVLVPKAKELLSSSESAYRSGSIDFLSLIDAQRKLLKYELNYQRAICDNQQGFAELEALAGETLH